VNRVPRFLILTLLFGIPRQVEACSCGGVPSKCDRQWNSGETIFVGKTIAMDRVSPPDDAFLSSYAARFTVEERLRGADSQSAEVVIYTGAGGGDCGYPFVPGTSYLIYASRLAGDGHLHVGICSETKPAVMAGGVLDELRAMRDRRQPDMIFGTIGMAPRGSGFEDLVDSKPLHNVPVQATDIHGRSFSTQTNDHGVYSFALLPVGFYTIEPNLPSGFARPARPLAAEVSSSEFACRVDNFARPDGRIEGIVVDGAGRALAGFVTIQPADPTEAALAQRQGGLPGYETGPDGKFSLPQLFPGRYRLLFHPRTGATMNFRATFYWPSDPGGAFELAFGQHIDAVLFKAPLE
jgi:hypothetical protein